MRIEHEVHSLVANTHHIFGYSIEDIRKEDSTHERIELTIFSKNLRGFNDAVAILQFNIEDCEFFIQSLENVLKNLKEGV